MARNELRDALYLEHKEARIAQALINQFEQPTYRALQIAHLVVMHGVPEEGPDLTQTLNLDYDRLEALHKRMPHQTHGH
jgi:hypothetical protein